MRRERQRNMVIEKNKEYRDREMDRLIVLERSNMSPSEEVSVRSASESNRFQATGLFCCPSDWMSDSEITPREWEDKREAGGDLRNTKRENIRLKEREMQEERERDGNGDILYLKSS